MPSRQETTSETENVLRPGSTPEIPGVWVAFWQTVVRFQREKITPAIGLRNTLGVTLPLALGAAFGMTPAGLAVSTGALNVSYSDSQEPYPVRAKRMLASSVLVGAAVWVGALCGHSPVLAALVAGFWAFPAGMLVALSLPAADLGVISLVTLVVYEAVPQTPERAAYAGLLAFAGGLLQTAFALALWPLRRYVPERLALAALFEGLARTAAQPIHASEAPPASAESTRAHNQLAALHSDHSIESARYLVLLSQAERIRIGLLALGRLHVRMGRDPAAQSKAGILDAYVAACAGILAYIAKVIAPGEATDGTPERLQPLERLAEEMRKEEPGGSEPAASMARAARLQMDALTGQLRAAMDLAVDATPAGLEAFERHEASRPWALRLQGPLATLRANLTFRSAACRHAIRLAVCVALGDMLGRGLGLQRSYWIPMTIAIVLKPDFTATFSRGVLRLTGTFTGLVLATLLFHLLPQSTVFQVAVVAVLTFILRCFGAANYGLFVAVVTALVVVLIAMAGAPPKELIGARALNTIVGGLIALTAYGLWPTWERSLVREALAQLLDACRVYFRALRDSYAKAGEPFQRELDRTRFAGRLARSNLEASVDRMNAEPGAAPGRARMLGNVLAISHRLAHAMMALEAGLATSKPAPPRPAFYGFANDVELTLYYLAAALRGADLQADQLPDLREAHRALVASGDALTERYVLVNVETDRITNSLNTLSGELLRWMEQHPVNRSLRAG